MSPMPILLATDLSCRCDRALDRAMALAAEWKTKLIVLHVMQQKAPVTDIASWRRPPDPQAAAQARVLGDLRGAAGLDLEVLVERGEPAARILETAERRGCGLLVTGVARDETLGRLLLGTTTRRLARRTKAPLLVVKSRPRGPYRDIIVATDHSRNSRWALEAALARWPAARFTVFHAARVVFEQFADDKMAAREDTARQAAAKTREFLAAIPAAAERDRAIGVVCECGEVGVLLQDLVQSRDADLVVLGTGGGRGLTGALLGSVAQDLLSRLTVDMFVVRGTKG